MISLDFAINSAHGLPCLILQIEFSSTFIGIANLEYTILPLGIRKVAIPQKATVKTISVLDRNAANKAFQI